MEKLSQTTLGEIEDYLSSLGSFDKEDTRKVLSAYPNFFKITISQNEFLNCVFLATKATELICPVNQDRRLSAVTTRAIDLLKVGNGDIGPNWNIIDMCEKTMTEIAAGRDPIGQIVLRDPQGGETRFRPVFKYIHDGCHRSLGYAIALQQGIVDYKPVHAYLATLETNN